jgi:hypothetical protein
MTKLEKLYIRAAAVKNLMESSDSDSMMLAYCRNELRIIHDDIEMLEDACRNKQHQKVLHCSTPTVAKTIFQKYTYTKGLEKCRN